MTELELKEYKQEMLSTIEQLKSEGFFHDEASYLRALENLNSVIEHFNKDKK